MDILKITKNEQRRNPHTTIIIMKKRFREIIRYHAAVVASHAINVDAPVPPSVQAGMCAEPDAAIPISQDGVDIGTRQAWLLRECRHGEVAKAVETVDGSGPN